MIQRRNAKQTCTDYTNILFSKTNDHKAILWWTDDEIITPVNDTFLVVSIEGGKPPKCWKLWKKELKLKNFNLIRGI